MVHVDKAVKVVEVTIRMSEHEAEVLRKFFERCIIQPKRLFSLLDDQAVTFHLIHDLYDELNARGIECEVNSIV